MSALSATCRRIKFIGRNELRSRKRLVIRRSLFDELGAFQGLNFEPEKYLKAILSRKPFHLRANAETNPAYKQIIPYALIVFEIPCSCAR
jgi:predicted NUDIX family phosphoesterase